MVTFGVELEMMKTVDKLELEIKSDGGNPYENAEHIEISVVPKVRIEEPEHESNHNALEQMSR